MRAGRAAAFVILGVAIGAAGMWGASRLIGQPLAPATHVRIYHGAALTNGPRQMMELFAPGPVNGFPLLGPEWRDSTGSWHDRGPVACLRYGRTRGITAGVVSVPATQDAPGGDVLTWVECPSG